MVRRKFDKFCHSVKNGRNKSSTPLTIFQYIFHSIIENSIRNAKYLPTYVYHTKILQRYFDASSIIIGFSTTIKKKPYDNGSRSDILQGVLE